MIVHTMLVHCLSAACCRCKISNQTLVLLCYDTVALFRLSVHPIVVNVVSYLNASTLTAGVSMCVVGEFE